MNRVILEKAREAVRRERAFVAAASFGVPHEAVGECAELIARAVLEAVADDLRAEGEPKALRDYAKARYLDFLENPELPWRAQPEGSARDYARAAAGLIARADQIEAGQP